MDRIKLNGSAQLSNGPTERAHGQAALLLIESLMHALLAKGVITREDFIETVEGAAEVECELMMHEATSPADSTGSFLQPLADAFRKELGR